MGAAHEFCCKRSAAAILPGRGGVGGALSDAFWRNPNLLLFVMLTPPLLWLGIIYLGIAFRPAHPELLFDRRILRSCGARVHAQDLWGTAAPLQSRHHCAHRHHGGAGDDRLRNHRVSDRLFRRALCPRSLEGLVLSRRDAALWSSYLVKVYAWKLILAKEGILTWVFDKLHLTFLIDAWLALPVVGGNSLSVSLTGTFLVFVYVWLPFMILPVQAALERVPGNLLEASADLGASPRQTFVNVLLPLALPGIIAGSIFTFSLTLGDYIIPQIIGTSHRFIGMAVYAHQGTAGNIPLAAAFTVVPVVIMGIYLWLAKRAGAFNAL
jgi:putative spermidine/putrescine transport system permease protein